MRLKGWSSCSLSSSAVRSDGGASDQKRPRHSAADGGRGMSQISEHLRVIRIHAINGYGARSVGSS